MANEKHLEIFRKGVEIWNQWRDENPRIKPDLSDAILKKADLRKANLNSVNLRNALLRYANLEDTFLDNAVLWAADLTGANLDDASLKGADLNVAHLEKANLWCANLTNANLEAANLVEANLKRAILTGAILRYAILDHADLRGSNLTSANLYHSYLDCADLSSAWLEYANLNGANLTGANLKNTNLFRIIAFETNLQGSTLTGACIQDWAINDTTNLQEVECDFIFLKKNISQELRRYVFADRRPHDLNKIFASGEFTKRYQKVLETVELYFEEGIDWQVFLASFEQLQEEERLKITDGSDRQLPIVQGIKNTGDGSFLIEVGVSPNTDKGKCEKFLFQHYQTMLEAKEQHINFLSEEIRNVRLENADLKADLREANAKSRHDLDDLKGIIKTLAEKDSRNIRIENGNYNEKIGRDYQQS